MTKSTALTCINILFSLSAEGCQFYGHSCYGGHGKRSLTSENEVMNQNNVIQPRIPPAKLTDNQIYRNPVFVENEQEERILEKFPRYRLMKIIKDMVSRRQGLYLVIMLMIFFRWLLPTLKTITMQLEQWTTWTLLWENKIRIIPLTSSILQKSTVEIQYVLIKFCVNLLNERQTILTDFINY